MGVKPKSGRPAPPKWGRMRRGRAPGLPEQLELALLVDTDPETRLRDLLAEVKRHRAALWEYRQSAYPEMVELPELRLRELYAQVRQHCVEHRLAIPSGIPIESS